MDIQINDSTIGRFFPFLILLLFIVQTGCYDNENETKTSDEYNPEETESQVQADSSFMHENCNPFPLHPPRASAFKVVPRNLLVGSNDTLNINYVLNKKLLPALDNAGYQYSFYCISDSGMAVVTQLERMNEDGTSDLQNRYVDGARPDKFWDYIKSLIKARPGFYRSIVFIISPYPVIQSREGLSRDGSDSLYKSGSDRPYFEILNYTFSKLFECTALIYQYKKPNEVDGVFEINNSPMTVTDQLTKAGIWPGLTAK